MSSQIDVILNNTRQERELDTKRVKVMQTSRKTTPASLVKANGVTADSLDL